MASNFITGNGKIFGNGTITFLTAPAYGTFLGPGNVKTVNLTDLSLSIVAPTSTSSAPFVYTSGNTIVASISGNNKILLNATGTVVITATQQPLGKYGLGSVKGNLTVQ